MDQVQHNSCCQPNFSRVSILASVNLEIVHIAIHLIGKYPHFYTVPGCFEWYELSESKTTAESTIALSIETFLCGL
ncbi:hypothetical protein DPMN_091927 [Dreissena polymorpha]|uniref:Uncharacterized protein n=1 Tax=Dreissena polymorpha TaxID=45954 RepID=A0A9D4QZN7_DREPO|nr:hypothetical protein DPMN_091927 [Dreissena polymorpha]